MNRLEEKKLVNENLAAGNVKSKKEILKNQNFLLFLTIVAILVSVGIAQPKFATFGNIINLFQTVSITGIIALGMSMVITTGNIDLSVATMVSFIACFTAYFVKEGVLNDVTALPFGLVMGLGCGVLNGLLASRTRAESFIITLATMMMFQGGALLAANGNVVTIGQTFSWFGTFKMGLIPIQIVIFLVLALVVFFVMKYTKYGRRVYAVGGNSEAAFLAGINVRRHKFLVFVVSGLMCSISAMIVLSRLSAANPNMAVGYEMESITACVAGGVSLMGGRGNTLGCFLGIMLMGIISNSLNLLMVPIFYHKIIIGIVLTVAVVLRTGRSVNQ